MTIFPHLTTLILLCLVPIEGAAPVCDSVDLIEHNHYYDECGKYVFDQIIFYDWCDEDYRYHVRAWRLVKHESYIPLRSQKRGGYEAIFHDGDVLRRVQADSFRETWTQFDPEIREQRYLSKERRKGLGSWVVRPSIEK